MNAQQPDPFQVMLAEVRQLVQTHFAKLGLVPGCASCRLPLGVVGLPCASPVLVPTEQGMQFAQGMPMVGVVPLGCQRCGSVTYYSMAVIQQNAASPIIGLR